MEKNLKPVESETDEQKAKEFAKDYQLLCDKHQMRIISVPVFKLRDDSTFSVVVQSSIGKLPQQS